MVCNGRAEPGATLVYGLKDKFDEQQFRARRRHSPGAAKLRPRQARRRVFIPQGLVHAIGAGILIAEIQQNSNVTYRVYDYNRRQRTAASASSTSTRLWASYATFHTSR